MMGEEVHAGSDDDDNANESTELKGFLSKWTNCEQIAFFIVFITFLLTTFTFRHPRLATEIYRPQ